MAVPGGAEPGGKILSRRYHLSSGRTPYTKSRKQGRQGFVGRVTDAVQNIVPGWLQKYFNKSEETNDPVERNIERKEHTVATDNGGDHIDEDEDEGSTSDPMISSSEDVAVSKKAPHPWSPGGSQTSSHNISKKTSFNVSAFGALSPAFGKISVLKCSQLGDSPLYPGKAAYGGAAAAPPTRMRGTPYQPSLREKVKAKPANIQSYGVSSFAAHRILEDLEKMSSPIAEAKKIPMLSPPDLPLSSTPANSSSVFGGSAPSSNPANSTSAAPQSTAPPSSNIALGIAAPARTSANSSNVFENTAPTNMSANFSSIFGNSAVAANPPAATVLFGQPSSTTSSSVGNQYESKSTFAFSGQESKPDTSSSNTSTNATSIVLGVKPASANPAAPSFNFGATNTSNVTGTGTSPFSVEQIHKALCLALQLVQTQCQDLGRAQVRLQSQLLAHHRCFPLVLNPSQFLALYLAMSNPLHLGSKPPSLPLSPLLLLPLVPVSSLGGNRNFNFVSGGAQPGFTFGSNLGGPSTFGSNSAPTPTQPGFMFNQTPAINMGEKAHARQ